jgi:uncharacterized Fe-S center protein
LTSIEKPDRQEPLSVLNAMTCNGCGECVVTCPHEAIKISWSGGPQSVQEKTVEFASALVYQKRGKLGAINFLMDISPDCDCLSRSDASIVPDIGMLASSYLAAGRAFPAVRGNGEDHLIPSLQCCYTASHLLYYAASLVAQHYWRRRRQVTLDAVYIGMAHAIRHHFD